MYAPRLPRIGTYKAWRDAARRLAGAGVPPEDIEWGLEGDPAPMFDAAIPEISQQFTVSKSFSDLTRSLIPERSGEGMALAYTLLPRVRDRPRLLGNRADPQVARAREIAKSVHRDLHKMHAFVRFREVGRENARRAFAAWFEPSHRIEELGADFFVDRFGDMDWMIVTPEVRMVFHERALTSEAIGSVRPDGDDPLEQLWATYYRNIFNPARLKVDAMRAEMPKKYWRNLPEAREIPSLIAGARARTEAMRTAGPTMPAPASIKRAAAAAPMKETQMASTPGPDLFGPSDIDEVARDAADCTRCALHGPATQIVFGEGPRDARLMIVGEQPGDREDIAGRPFVGPAGQLFDEIAAQAGLDRSAAYVTNAVKHFKFVQKGKRRIHQKPAASEVTACNWWLTQELSMIDPEVVVAMGATALHALTGNGAGILKRRGSVEKTRDGRDLFVTVHPSFLLRLPDEASRERETMAFREDLSRVQELLAG